MKAFLHTHRRALARMLFVSPFILLIALVMYVGQTFPTVPRLRIVQEAGQSKVVYTGEAYASGPANRHGVRYRVMAWTYLAVAGWLWRLAQKLHASNAAESLASDPRAPLLYLRAFKADEAKGPQNANYGAAQTREQALAELFRQQGPFVAVGKPDEMLPTLGADRDYVPDTDWRSWVERRLYEAQVVVIQAGCGDGLAWEIETALEFLPAERLVLFTDVEDADYTAFHERFSSLFPQGLPTQEERERARIRRLLNREEGVLSMCAEFIVFQPDWRPVCLTSRMTAWEYYRTVAKGKSPVVRYATALRSSGRPELARVKVRVNVFEVMAWFWFGGFLLISPLVIAGQQLWRWRCRRRLRSATGAAM